jgi:hypothetical protein
MNYLIATGIFILSILAWRLGDMPANFTPILAAAVFMPQLIKIRWLQPAIPVALMLITDIFLGFHSVMLWTYLCVILATQLGAHLQNRYAAAVTSVFAWHIIVNGALAFGVMSYMPVWQVYAQAIPFDFRLLVSTLMFTVIFHALQGFTLQILRTHRQVT